MSLPIKKQSFSEQFKKYFQPFWEAHSLPKDWLNMDTQSWTTEDKPICQVMVLGSSKEYLDMFRGFMQAFMSFNFGKMNNSFIENGMHNKAGNFIIINLSKETRQIEEIFRGRTFDFIVLMPDVRLDPETERFVQGFLKDPTKPNFVQLI